jgi:copper chaperone CopZ
MKGTSYVHMIEGRLRIKVPEIKGSPDQAREVEAALVELEGVSHVKANALTGNVLVLFESDITNHYHIIGTMKDLGCFSEEHVHAQRPASRWSEALAGPVAQVVIERAILALM